MDINLDNLSCFLQKLDDAADITQTFNLFAQEILPLTGFDYCGLYLAEYEKKALVLKQSKKQLHWRLRKVKCWPNTAWPARCLKDIPF